MSMGFLCICVYDLHLKKVNIKENCKWSIYAPHMSELPHLNFHFEFVINLIYSINQINLYGSYNEDTLGLFSIRLIFTPINSYGLYMRYYEKWSEIARGDSTRLLQSIEKTHMPGLRLENDYHITQNLKQVAIALKDQSPRGQFRTTFRNTSCTDHIH